MESPGVYHYSDTNYVILVMIWEQLHWKALHSILGQQLFTPLGMRDTYVHYDYKTQTDFGATDTRLSTRYRSTRRNAFGKFAWTFPDHWLPSVPFLMVPPRHVFADWASAAWCQRQEISALLCGPFGLIRKSGKSSLGQWRQDSSYGFGVEALDMGSNAARNGACLGHSGNGGAALFYWPEQDVFAGTLNNNASNFTTMVKQFINSGLVPELKLFTQRNK